MVLTLLNPNICMHIVHEVRSRVSGWGWFSCTRHMSAITSWSFIGSKQVFCGYMYRKRG